MRQSAVQWGSDAGLRGAGAVKTIIQMLGSEQKRAAAVTMLGKTVEQSADQVVPSAFSCRSKLGSCYTTCTRYNELLSLHSEQSQFAECMPPRLAVWHSLISVCATVAAEDRGGR